ncbi:MAG: CRTAC1 family protein [Planctomycetota bacterium]|nr:CRTAC1 family protein [Planctomycetota bacterium]
MRMSSARRFGAITLGLLLALGSMASGDDVKKPDEAPTIRFVDRLAQAGITFQHFGERYRWCSTVVDPSLKGAKGLATNEKIDQALFAEPEEFAQRHLIRMNGSGAAWIDYDSDGDWDLYLVNGKGEGESGPETNVLYKNNGDGTFTDVTKGCGAADEGEGMAVCTADYNNDGHTDLFITNYRGFALYRNLGNGKFQEVTKKAFARCPPKEYWYGGATWGDMDGDGDLDLYVAGYVDIQAKPDNTALRFPMDFKGFPNTLYRNEGDGTFTDVTKKAGVEDVRRKSMQVLFADLNSDGNPDILVANDTDANSLYLGRGDGTFAELSGASGVSSTDGSMGIAWGDYTGDGKMDLYISNYIGEADLLLKLIDDESTNDGMLPNALYTFDFDSPSVLKATWGKVGWGTGLEDLDNDGDLDLFVSSGHLNSVGGDNRDQNLVFANDGKGHFDDVSATSGILDAGRRIYRGSIFGDYDNDGRTDIYVTNNGEKSYEAASDRLGVLLQNTSPTKGHWLTLRFQGVESNRDGYGVRVWVEAGGKKQVRELVSGQGYFSSNAKEIHFGLGDHPVVKSLEVHWPSGKKQLFENFKADRILKLVEGKPLPE